MLRFAVAGAPRSTPPPGGSLKGLKRAKELGINAMELEWVQSVPTRIEHMEEIGRLAKSLDIELTVHAPYYINLNSTDGSKRTASKARILQALTMAQICGARSVCVHAAFYLGHDPDSVFRNVYKGVEEIMKRKATAFPNVNLALETMGKQTQFGTLEEVLRISKEFDIYPCIDSAHLHARSNGAVNSEEEWQAMLDLYEKYLGRKSLKNMHMHFSGIAYGPKGEKHHLPLEESDAEWKVFVKVLKECEVGGVCVCESPVQEDDTQLMLKSYEGL